MLRTSSDRATSRVTTSSTTSRCIGLPAPVRVCPPEQPSDDGAEELLERTAAVFKAGSSFVRYRGRQSSCEINPSVTGLPTTTLAGRLDRVDQAVDADISDAGPIGSPCWIATLGDHRRTLPPLADEPDLVAVNKDESLPPGARFGSESRTVLCVN